MFCCNNKFIFSKTILLLSIKMAFNYLYSYYWNVTLSVCYIIFKFIFYYICCTQLGCPYNIKKFLNKELKYVNRVYKRVDI